MTNNPQQSPEEMPKALRRALIECGALIPTTPEEVLLAEKHVSTNATAEEIEKSFKKLKEKLGEDAEDFSFMKISPELAILKEENLAMAARNGEEMDSETLAKIESSLSTAFPENKKQPKN